MRKPANPPSLSSQTLKNKSKASPTYYQIRMHYHKSNKITKFLRRGRSDMHHSKEQHEGEDKRASNQEQKGENRRGC